MWLARFYINGTSDNVNFCFVELVFDKLSRIETGDTIILIWGSIISDCFFLLFWSFANTCIGVFIFFLRFLIISMQLSLNLRKYYVNVTKKVISVFSSALLLFELLFIIVWRLY